MVIVPYLLSVWAIHYKDEVATRLKIGRKEQERYGIKAADLFETGLKDYVNSIWYSRLGPHDKTLDDSP